MEIDEDANPWHSDGRIYVMLQRTDILLAAVDATHFTESDDDSEADEGEREAHRQYVDWIVERYYDYRHMRAVLYPEYETDSEEEEEEEEDSDDTDESDLSDECDK
nr:uncharacterized protein LOC106684734 [Halyomorpha halys]